jgi:hypothetical protein
LTSEIPYNIISPIFKQFVAAIKKDNTNLKECAVQLLKLVASVKRKVGKNREEEDGVLALPTFKRKCGSK